jgi:dUTP pyrophosphatase
MYVPTHLENLRHFYRQRIDAHNENVFNDKYADSGFDLALPQDFIVDKAISFKIPLTIHGSMYTGNGTPQGFSLLPRSSIIKTPLRLSNSVGVIDRGYRGIITAVVDNLNFNSNNHLQLNALDRYFQIVHPSYNPFKVVMVDSKEELGNTMRNEGGFGSTGR